MSKEEKLKERFKRLPKDFTFEELRRLFGLFGFQERNKGMTSGSRVVFVKESERYSMHKPHPSHIIPPGALRGVYNYLRNKGYI